MSRLNPRVVKLEREAQAQPEDNRPWWWELPPGSWHLGKTDMEHEAALDELDRLDALDAEEGRPPFGFDDDGDANARH